MSEELKITGKITNILPTESGLSKANKEWKKRLFVINTGREYNSEVCFQVFGEDKCENLTKFNKVGDDVEVSFNVSSREFNGKFYHNLDAWLIKKTDAGAATPNEAAQVMAEEEDNSLPF